MSQEPSKPLLRNLGEFFGHIVQGIKSKPDEAGAGAPNTPAADAAQTPPTVAVRQVVEEREIVTAEGKVILRRTVIDEVAQVPAPPDGPSGSPESRPQGEQNG